MELFFAGILLFTAGGILSEFINYRYKPAVFLIFSVSGTVFTGYAALLCLTGQCTPQITFYMNFPFGETGFVMDSLSSLFVFIFSAVYLPVSIYSKGYLEHYNDGKKERLHYICLSLLISSMMLVVTVTNAIMFLVLWEIMSLSSFFLVSFENEKNDVYNASINYLIAMHVGVVFIISAFAYLSYRSGGNSFNDFRVVLNSGKGIADLLFFISFIGFGTKAGFFPFHSWLPKAHPAAPSHVSALMSGLMIKTGIYGIMRFLTLIDSPSKTIGFTLLAISSFTAIFGILYAMNDRDMKRQLAYSSIENIGIIGMALSIGILGFAFNNIYMSVLGFTGAILHIINHSLFKTLLFLASGSVYLNTHSKNMESMGGLIKKLPYTASFFILASVAISGLPPLNGFISEFFIYYSMLSGIKTSSVLFVTMIAGFSLLALIGAIAIIAFTKSSGIIFLGSPRNGNTDHYHEKISMVIPMGIIAVLMFLAGILPHKVIGFTSGISAQLVKADTSAEFIKIISLASDLSIALVVFCGILVTVTFFRVIKYRKEKVGYFKTWNCGYQGITPRMQYTASSFSADTVYVTKPILFHRKVLVKPEGIFPGKSALKTENIDATDIVITFFIKKWIEKFFNAVSVIQSRTAQQYVIYVIVFIIVTFVWVIWIK
ncbi:MAG TPA: proton-conducting transporter membrane subunit [Spirochaetota bacterium]|nr:proton-conducting transporter membrane subunit [Spirochaetota bacterium]HPS86474.1 proton-conducting transporter membrane subunit [Spirochaetota bacterium]